LQEILGVVHILPNKIEYHLSSFGLIPINPRFWLTKGEAMAVRICKHLGLMLLITIQLLPVAAATQLIAVTAGRGHIRSGSSAAHDIMGEVRQGELHGGIKRGFLIPADEDLDNLTSTRRAA
jgi:hypothetical protein